MPNAMTDRRVAPRYPLILLAEVTDLLSSTKFTARTSDLSRTGCYIDMLHPLPRGIGIAFAEDLAADQQAVLDRWLSAAAKANR